MAADAIVTSAKEPEPVIVEQPETVEEGALPGDPGEAVEGEHACNECGMVFQRRYTLIMHALKHEKARIFKCSVRTLGLNKCYNSNLTLCYALLINFLAFLLTDMQ